ncbi:MAG: uncharacterized protein KVP18_003954 [Porospora cf. gigantea A]|uniref:uncharacterized protein n=1 Tax=Porospora cf. gigantea A TaxID=2853593 RepID=UPI003559E744|nr:MAG: hypothetical protein KVP18_003954 [Porospora cf. gigantea A]
MPTVRRDQPELSPLASTAKKPRVDDLTFDDDLTIDNEGTLTVRDPVSEALHLPKEAIKELLIRQPDRRGFFGVHLDTSTVLAMCSELTWNLESAQQRIPRDDKALRQKQVQNEILHRGEVGSCLLALWSPSMPKYISDQTAYELEKMVRTIGGHIEQSRVAELLKSVYVFRTDLGPEMKPNYINKPGHGSHQLPPTAGDVYAIEKLLGLRLKFVDEPQEFIWREEALAMDAERQEERSQNQRRQMELQERMLSIDQQAALEAQGAELPTKGKTKAKRTIRRELAILQARHARLASFEETGGLFKALSVSQQIGKRHVNMMAKAAEFRLLTFTSDHGFVRAALHQQMDFVGLGILVLHPPRSFAGV